MSYGLTEATFRSMAALCRKLLHLMEGSVWKRSGTTKWQIIFLKPLSSSFSDVAVKLFLPVSASRSCSLSASLSPSVSHRGRRTSVALGKCFAVGRSLGFKWL